MNNIHVPNNELQVSDSNKIYDKYSDEINKKINTFKAKPDIDDDRKDDIEESGELVRLCNVRKLQIDTSISYLCFFCFFINFRCFASHNIRRCISRKIMFKMFGVN